MTRLVPVLMLLAALALGACGDEGGGGRSGSREAERLLDEAFANTGKVRSARTVLSISAELHKEDELGARLSLEADGPFERGEGFPRFAFAIRGGVDAGPLASVNADFTLTSTGDAAFVNLENQDYAVGDKAFRRLARDYLAERGTRAMLRPRTWLGRPRIVPADPQRAGEAAKVEADANWAGVTRAYNALLERARSMSTQAAPVPEPLDADEVADKAGTATFTAYVDKTERVLRILRLQAELDAPKGAEGYDTVHVSFLLRLDRVNEDQDIAAPERPQRPEALKRKLEALDLGELGKLVVTGHFQ